ncbi:MAG: glycoside hydrolase family 3 C-terminal domain-containing protein [Lachnospiraceae bacterium]|nr:glycoside hydrolase family 3 C-terminal domain-containing protein [Lachnospiraceae bacterium]
MMRTMKTRAFSGTKDPAISDREKQGQALARKAAAEGMVLLKNDAILPLSKERPLALLGAGAGRTIKGGTGSGDVCERASVSVYEGMKEAGFIVTSGDWIADYDQRYIKAREDWKAMILEEAGGARTPLFFNVYASHAFEAPEGRPITEADFSGADLAVYVISRIAGEGADRDARAGDYELTDREKEDLKTLADLKKEIVVLLNIGGLINLKDILENPAVKAILYISQPGMSGGHAVADLLSGAVNPCGKLTDSWAASYSDYPNYATFSRCNGNVTTEKYEEGIYVGYRYFDTYEVPVQYSFGYGLSYTDFQVENAAGLQADDQGLTLTLQVKNTGNTAGKEVVQVYAALPMGRLPKEYRRLAGFKKTALLQPGETETVTIRVDAKDLASFDEAAESWVLESGRYILMAGNSLETSRVVGSAVVEKEIVLEETYKICPLQEELQELSGKEERRKERLEELAAICQSEGCPMTIFAPVKRANPTWKQSEYELDAAKLVEELDDEELIHMCAGEISRGHDIALGAAGIMVPGAAGESCNILEKTKGVPGIAMADGPAGIRVIRKYLADEANGVTYTQGFLGAMEQGFFSEPQEEKEGCVWYYQFCTAWPIGTLLAQSWDEELQKEVGRMVGIEMQELGLSWWLAPGMNIHRNPLCGRNFEYFSEDPYVSGMTAAAITQGVQSVPGVGTTIKHYCCNNQEDNRVGSNSIVSQRTLREIYLRGFELAVRTSQPMSIMSSYNLLNGVHTANCADILLTVLRKEWGFRGFVMTDWTTTANGSISHLCIKNGNDLIMPGSPDDITELRQALSDGKLTKEELKASVARLLTVIFQTNAYEDAVPYGDAAFVTRSVTL